MKKIKGLMVVLAIVILGGVTVNARAASVIVTIQGPLIGETDTLVIESDVKNNTTSYRYTTNHLYVYLRSTGDYVGKDFEEKAILGGQTLGDVEYSYSSGYKYMARGSVYNSGAPASGTYEEGYDYCFWN